MSSLVYAESKLMITSKKKTASIIMSRTKYGSPTCSFINAVMNGRIIAEYTKNLFEKNSYLKNDEKLLEF